MTRIKLYYVLYNNHAGKYLSTDRGWTPHLDRNWDRLAVDTSIEELETRLKGSFVWEKLKDHGNTSFYLHTIEFDVDTRSGEVIDVF